MFIMDQLKKQAIKNKVINLLYTLFIHKEKGRKEIHANIQS